MAENDFMGPLERPSLEMYIEDLSSELRRIDAHVFSPRQHTNGVIHVLEDYPDEGGRGTRIGVVASFFSGTHPSYAGNIVALMPEREHYVLWKAGISKSIDAAMRTGLGDAGIKKLWFRSAVALVRARVLCCAQREMHRSGEKHFPAVRLRTCKSLRIHAQLFLPTIFRELSELPSILEGKGLTTAEIDMRLTQAIVDATLQVGFSELDALSHITTF